MHFPYHESCVIFIVSRIVTIKGLCLRRYVTAADSSKNILLYNDRELDEWWIGYDFKEVVVAQSS
jgi:hypothetical protein